MTSINKAHAPVVPQTVKTDTAQKTSAPQAAPAQTPSTGWSAKPSARPAVTTPTPAAAPIMPAVTGTAPFIVTSGMVEMAKKSGNPAVQAGVLGMIAKDRSNLLLSNNETRVQRAQQLFDGMTPQQVGQVRAAYIKEFGMDPEHHIRSDDWGQPLARLDRATETQLMGALNGPQMKADAGELNRMLKAANAGTLTPADRQEYFAMMPRIGLYDSPTRQQAGGPNLDSQERTLIEDAFQKQGTGVPFDQALKTIESKLPGPDLTPKGPREKNIAAVVSSHGAQWQELMGWADKMKDAGYNVQLFTPEGRPVAFQRDSMDVSTHTSGFGAPADLDPAGRTGQIAKELLGNTAPASSFDPKNFGAVYLAGGLGFNEDVAVAKPETLPNGQTHTKLTANPNIEKMMNSAIDQRLPIVALCHGPTLLAALDINVNGKKEPLNKGIETASLPPFEGYVGLTGRKEIQFNYDVNTHNALAETGGQTHVLKDIANMSRVVKQEKDGQNIITGPGPQAASNLADATMEVLKKRWP